jgi:N-acetylmuramoyl-L-alanine amidase
MRKITKIIIHCSATREGLDFDAKDINNWHNARGWNGIGYHYVVKLDGTIERGRDEERVGSHTYGYNRESIGVCYIGGLDKDRKPKDTRTPFQIMSLREIVGELLHKYPGASVHGHNEFSSKSCPCFNVHTEL